MCVSISNPWMSGHILYGIPKESGKLWQIHSSNATKLHCITNSIISIPIIWNLWIKSTFSFRVLINCKSPVQSIYAQIFQRTVHFVIWLTDTEIAWCLFLMFVWAYLMKCNTMNKKNSCTDTKSPDDGRVCSDLFVVRKYFCTIQE